MSLDTYDLAIIGSGAAGLTAAFTAKGFSKKVVIIEKHRTGGECTWSGCVPSKALINQAASVHAAHAIGAIVTQDSKKVLEQVRSVIASVYAHETPDVLMSSGIDYIQGEAVFASETQLIVGERLINAKKIIIATGSSPFIPDIQGLSEVPFLTNESLFTLEALPSRIIILGGGAIGVEMAQAMNRLGTAVQLVEMMPTILFREERELSDMLTKKLESEGLDFRVNTKALAVRGTEGGIQLEVECQGERYTLESDAILVASGRKANVTGLNLERANVAYSPKGIQVNQYMQTSSKSIFAIGDVVGPYQFSHMANYQGILAVRNAVLPIKKAANYKHVSWTTFTDPEFARAGMTEAEARERYGNRIRVYRHSYAQLDRALTKPGSIGMAKVVLDVKGKVLGASVLGDRAGEIISEVQVLKTLNRNFAYLANVIHPYPTYSEILVKIAKKVAVDNLLNHPIVRLFRKP